ncbi:cardioacceleratory peptide receptor [Elysia marginata]|uniref:Cardioacceleratory peptide receptor n=1 Tax=Elysia marginata TaxID=1093978 RepID=A0AAV4HSH1_9GAST|nr:cardioacceleratory peptide receptor [Elysia marginata]
MGRSGDGITTPVPALEGQGQCASTGNGSDGNATDQCTPGASQGGLPEYYKVRDELVMLNVLKVIEDAQITFLVLLLCVIVIGNAIVLAAISLSQERRRSRMNFFIMHLALCDLLTGPLIVLVDIITKVTEYWYAGEAVCKLLKFSQVTIAYSSTYMLVALSIDRLDAVARPLHFTGSWLRAKLLVATAWILSALFAVPQLVLFEVINPDTAPMCHMHLETVYHWRVRHLDLVNEQGINKVWGGGENGW